MMYIRWQNFRLWLGSKVSGISICDEVMAAYDAGKRVGYNMRWGSPNGGKD